MLGEAVTLTVEVFKAEQFPLDPFTVYTALAVGDTTMLVALEPVLQVYDPAPLAVRVAEVPLQMLAEFTEMLGVVFTVTLEVLNPLQFPLDPVTVYTAFAVGDTTMLVALDPVLHV